MPINYGEEDYPFIKEALRYYIEQNPGCKYGYRNCYDKFEIEPCIICGDTHYKPDSSHRLKGKLICDDCWKEKNEN